MNDLFEKLSKTDCSEHIEGKETGKYDKNGNKVLLNYLSWSWAVSEFSKAVDDWDYKIGEVTHDPVLGYEVHTSITVGNKTKDMWLPVMDGANRAMKDHPYQISMKNGKNIDVAAASMTDINKAKMRCLVKNMAMFGLGLYIYAGEDLPETDEAKQEETKQEEAKKEEAKKEVVEVRATPEEVANIEGLYDALMIARILQHYQVESLSHLTKANVKEVIDQAMKRNNNAKKQTN